MANPFDKFDPASGNPFDKFDAAPAITKPSAPFGEQLNQAVSDIPRQLGLTARYGLEGVGGTLDMLASPIRAGLNAVLPNSAQIKPGGMQYVADKLGLPQPQNATERIVGDAAKTIAGSAVPLGIANQVGKTATGTTQAIAKMVAANPASQLASAGSGGLAGSYTRETGGNDASQMLAAIAASVATPLAMNAGTSALNAMKNIASPKITPQQIDLRINQALQPNGMTFADIPAGMQDGIRQDVAQALKTSDNLSGDAIRRLADYRLTNTTPTAAGLTLDPATITQQRNLAKLGINSRDVAAQQLGQVENANNQQLTSVLNDLGAKNGLDAENAGGKLASYLADYAAKNKQEIGGLYSAARDSAGRAAPLDPSHFTQKAGDLLDQANLNTFMPGEIRSMLNSFSEGKTPLNVNTAEQFKTILGNSQRSSDNGNVRTALGLIRQALDETPLMTTAPKSVPSVPPAAGVNSGLSQIGNAKPQAIGAFSGSATAQNAPQVGQEAIDAFTAARAANRNFMGTVEQTPALDSVLNGASDKGFFQKHVIAGDSTSLKNTMNVLQDTPEAIQLLRDQTLAYLKDKALSGAADEVGKFSNSRFNGALKMLGENKLNLLFNPEEVNQLKAVGRVASYEQFQPAGSAVNNSNTAAAGMAGMIDRLGNSPLLSKIPMGTSLADPLRNISIGIQAGKVMNIPNALSLPQVSAPPAPYGLLSAPAIFMNTPAEDRQKKKGLLFTGG